MTAADRIRALSRWPIVVSPMAGGPTGPPLVIAAARAGALPFLAAGNKTPTAMVAEIDAVRGATDAAFGVNVFVPGKPTEDAAALTSYLGSLEAEEQTIRQQIVALQKTLDQALAPPVLPPGDMPQATGAPGGATGTGAPPAPLNGLQIKRMYDSAFQDFVGGEFELAIQGFEGYLRNAPNGADAPEAQFQIGQAQFALGKNKEAVQAYTTLITTYKGSPREAEAYYKRGLANLQLNQKDRAKQDFEYVIKNFPDNVSMVTLAQQRLDAIK